MWRQESQPRRPNEVPVERVAPGGRRRLRHGGLPGHGLEDGGEACRRCQLGDGDSVVDLVDVPKTVEQAARDTQGTEALELCRAGAARAHRNSVEHPRNGTADADGPVPTVLGRSEDGPGAFVGGTPHQGRHGPIQIGTLNLGRVHSDHQHRVRVPVPRIVDGPRQAGPETARTLRHHVEAGEEPRSGRTLQRQHPMHGVAGTHRLHGVEQGGCG